MVAIQPNVVNIYRAPTATLVRQLHPDTALFAALGLLQPQPVTPTPQSPPLYPQLMYSALLWSPDGRRLAMTFDLDSGGYNPMLGQLQVISGLVLLDADGGNERVLVDHQTSAQGTQAAYIVWDVQEGTTIPAGNASSASSPCCNGNSLPPALSYAWGSGSSLVPGTPLSLGAEPPSPALDLVGNPDGGHSFGLWQPGQIQIYAVPVAGQQAPTYLYVFQTTFSAWSPTGRYFEVDLNTGGLLIPAGQQPHAQCSRDAERHAARSGGAAPGTRRRPPTGASARRPTPGGASG
jgi:hypothetical protein